MELTISQLAVSTVLVPVALLILLIYTSLARVKVYESNGHNGGFLRDPAAATAKRYPHLFLGSAYTFIVIAAGSQIVSISLAWAEGEIWLKVCLNFILSTNILREVRLYTLIVNSYLQWCPSVCG
jgi:hypothetical protein